MKLREIDLRKGQKSNHPDIKTDGTNYLCKIGRGYYAGTFHKVWFGISFNGWHAPLQFDTPGTNCSDWKKVWEIIEDGDERDIKSTRELKGEHYENNY